jgi:hypothetical protein
MPRTVKHFRTPKGCIVKHIELRGGAQARALGFSSDVAEVTYSCGRDYHQGYERAYVRVQGVNVPGAHITGESARIGFVLSPRHVRCQTQSGELVCTVHSDGRQLNLAGGRRRRRSQ